MRLAINGRFLTQSVTGVQRYASETLIALDRLIGAGACAGKGIDVELLTPRQRTWTPNLAHIPIKQIGRLEGHAWEQLELPLHSGRRFLLNLCNTAPALKRSQAVVIHDVATFAMPHTFSPSFRLWYQLLLPLLGKRARKIITVSKFSKSELTRLCQIPPEKLTVIHESGEHILRQQTDAGIIESHGLHRRPYVLAVSSLNPSKNFGALVRAAEQLNNNGFDLVVAGAANPKVFRRSQSSPSHRIVYLGYVSEGELRALYESAACFVYPSLYEGFGLPPLEAMACGCPVIASHASSIPEVCGEAALYCDPRNPSDIADKIQRLMGNPALRNQLRVKGRERSAMFSWESSALCLLEAVRLGASNTTCGEFR
jgi:glycosyltransferase involved in cell wall biosynthesis